MHRLIAIMLVLLPLEAAARDEIIDLFETPLSEVAPLTPGDTPVAKAENYTRILNFLVGCSAFYYAASDYMDQAAHDAAEEAQLLARSTKVAADWIIAVHLGEPTGPAEIEIRIDRAKTRMALLLERRKTREIQALNGLCRDAQPAIWEIMKRIGG